MSLNDKEPTYWCSIGVLYYYNNQYHEALDTYARCPPDSPQLPGHSGAHRFGAICDLALDATEAIRAVGSMRVRRGAKGAFAVAGRFNLTQSSARSGAPMRHPELKLNVPP